MGAIIRLLLKLFAKQAPKATKISKLGRVKFGGLVAKRPLNSLTHTEINNALKKAGIKLGGPRDHFAKRLVERGPKVGIETLDDFARQLSRGVAQAGKKKGTIDIVLPGGAKVAVDAKTGRFITFF